MASTRLGLIGAPARPYAAFAAKQPAPPGKVRTRLGLMGAPGRPYAAFVTKQSIPPLGALSEDLGVKFISVRRSVVSQSVNRSIESRTIKREVKQ